MEFLPVEVITHILTFLNHGDQISLSLTAKHFYTAYHDPLILKNVIVKFDHCQLDVIHLPLSTFARSSINYQNLVLGSGIENVILTETTICQGFWNSFGKNIKELTIETPGNVGFKLLAAFMPNLRVLRILNRGTRPIVFTKQEISQLKLNLIKVHTLEICSNYEQFEELLELLPELRNLYLEGFSSKQQRTFARNNSISLNFLIHYITKVRTLEMKGLLLHSYCVEENSNEKFFYELASTTGLLLKNLACSIEGVPISLLHQLFNNMQSSLKSLDLTSWAGISSEIYQIIFTYLKNIEQLTFRGQLSLDGLHHISKLNHIKVLKFKDSFGKLESSKKFNHFLATLKSNTELKELQIDTACLNSQECSQCFLKFITDPNVAKNLEILNISKSNIDDANFSLLINHAKNLKELYMSDCKKIVKFERVTIPNKALHDTEMLKNLQVLDISHCIQLKSCGMIKMFHFNQLRHLYMNNLEAVTPLIIKIIVDHCPSLDKLALANCHQITDQCIEFISKLPRLQYLDVSGCKNLTKLTEYSLWKCLHLKYLHAVGLERLDMSIIMIFTKIQCLQLYRCDKKYTRADFEAKKYTTKQKMQNVRKYLVFTQFNQSLKH
uniref:CSON010656 protein n=1 Tax=Culicoides sonorensis TaxID=179676 RepID=A0A336KHV9_CULSO